MKLIFEGSIEQIQKLQDEFDMLIIEHGEDDLPQIKNDYYQIGNLWCVAHVTNDYECTPEEALDVLEAALINEATMEQIYHSIEVEADVYGLNKKIKTEDGLSADEVKEYYLNSGFQKYNEEPFLSEYDDLDWIEYANENDLKR